LFGVGVSLQTKVFNGGACVVYHAGRTSRSGLAMMTLDGVFGNKETVEKEVLSGKLLKICGFRSLSFGVLEVLIFDEYCNLHEW
jgi:hypothetical protein